MEATVKKLVFAVVLAALLTARNASAQFEIQDPANIAQHGIIASTMQVIGEVSKLIEDSLHRMGQSLWLLEDLGRYQAANQPLWRTYQVGTASPPAVAFMDALNGPTPRVTPPSSGGGGTPADWSDQELRDRIAAELHRVHSTDDPDYWFTTIRAASVGADWDYWVGRIETGDGVDGDPDTPSSSPDAALVKRLAIPSGLTVSDSLRYDLATLDFADSALRTAIDATGRIRGNRMAELNAIAAEVAHLHNSSTSATAVLEKVAGSKMIQAHQKRTRMELASSIVELQLVESERYRQAENDALRRRLGSLDTPSDQMAGADADFQWRQP